MIRKNWARFANRLQAARAQPSGAAGHGAAAAAAAAVAAAAAGLELAPRPDHARAASEQHVAQPADGA